jgi:hypothetical protein
VAALFVPWTATGTLSSATLLEAARLVRRGTLDAVVPPSVAYLLLVPGLVGVVLLGLAGFSGRAVAVVRTGLAAVGAALCVALAVLLTGGDAGRIGAGTWLAGAGVVVALVAVAASLAGRSR